MLIEYKLIIIIIHKFYLKADGLLNIILLYVICTSYSMLPKDKAPQG